MCIACICIYKKERQESITKYHMKLLLRPELGLVAKKAGKNCSGCGSFCSTTQRCWAIPGHGFQWNKAATAWQSTNVHSQCVMQFRKGACGKSPCGHKCGLEQGNEAKHLLYHLRPFSNFNPIASEAFESILFRRLLNLSAAQQARQLTAAGTVWYNTRIIT